VKEQYIAALLILGVPVGIATAQEESETLYFGGGDAVGDVRSSLLDESSFKNFYGPDWELMKKKEVSGTHLSAFLSSSLRDKDGKLYLPDARGKFLRMHNNGLSGPHSDPENSRSLGSYQSDATGPHTHSYLDIYWSEKNGSVFSQLVGNKGQQDLDNNGFQKKRTTSPNEQKESRPKNISVNYFVRVRCTTSLICKKYF